MKLEEIRTLAKSRHIKTDKLSKAELIHKIQMDEGNFDCYATANSGACDQLGCIWRDDCFDAARAMEAA